MVKEKLIIDSKVFKRKLWLKFSFYFSLTVLCFAGLFLVKNPLLFTLSFIAFGFSSMLFAFNFSHDFSHNTVFRSKKLNNFCFVLLYTLMGAHAEAWKQRHIQSHHYAPNVEDYDTDLQISSLIRVIPNSTRHWFHKYQHWYAPLAYTSYSLFWILIKDFVLLYSKDDFNARKDLKYHATFWMQKGIYFTYILVLPVLFSMQTWYLVLIAFLVMHLTQSLFLLFTFFMTHHVESTQYPTTDDEGCINTSWLMNQIQSSNDMHPFSKTANFVLGGFNNHIAHHLFPHVHHLHYPTLNVILYAILRKHSIEPNQTSYLGGIASHLRLLKKMGKPNKVG